jgi:hypothetical protein
VTPPGLVHMRSLARKHRRVQGNTFQPDPPRECRRRSPQRAFSIGWRISQDRTSHHPVFLHSLGRKPPDGLSESSHWATSLSAGTPTHQGTRRHSRVWVYSPALLGRSQPVSSPLNLGSGVEWSRLTLTGHWPPSAIGQSNATFKCRGGTHAWAWHFIGHEFGRPC